MSQNISPLAKDNPANAAKLRLNDNLRIAPHPDGQAILAAAKAYAEADISVTPGSLAYSPGASQGAFAKVNVATNPGGYYILLKKVYGLWMPLLAGQDLPGKIFGKKYGLPEGWYSPDYD